MSKTHVAAGGIVVLVAALLTWFFVAQAQTTPGSIQIRWLIAHEPSEVFVRAEKAFAEDLAKNTQGRFTVKILLPEDVGVQGEVSSAQVDQLLQAGEIDLVSENIDSIISSHQTDLEVLHLPYLFHDYASADTVLDGSVGSKLLSLLDEITPAHALAFTYSGGLRIIATTKKAIQTPGDARGLNITTWGDKVVRDNLASLGAQTIPVAINAGKDQLEGGQADAAELTYSRASGVIGPSVKYVTETNHILFLSALLASNTFMQSLSEADKVALQGAASAAAATERQDSIAYSESVKENLQKQGVTIIGLSSAARKEFEAWGSRVRSGFDATPRGRALIEEILSAQEN